MAVTLGMTKADIAFGKGLDKELKQRPLDLKAVGKLFFQYGVYLDLLESAKEEPEKLVEEDDVDTTTIEIDAISRVEQINIKPLGPLKIPGAMPKIDEETLVLEPVKVTDEEPES